MNITRHIRFAFFVVLLGAVFASCGDDGDEPVGPDPSGPITFAADIQPIFTARCAVSGCHVNPGPSANLNLSAGVAYTNIVNVPTEVFTPGVRVTPFSPDSSVLYLLVEDGLMPARGSRLTSKQLAGIKTWIEEGALDN
jgi:hypothetical protein